MKKFLPTLVIAGAVFLASAPNVQAKTLEQKIETAKHQLAEQSKKVNINSATASQLQKLKGIGAKKAADIVAYRDANGKFKSVAELAKVKGIGEKMVAKLKDLVEVK